MDPQWLTWAKHLQAIAQTGLAFSRDVYDIERYQSIRQVAAEMMAVDGTQRNALQFAKIFDDEVGYATPKIDVRAAVFQNDRVLLVKERIDGCWSLPGGWADVGDSPSGAIVREVKEESGFDVKASKLIALMDRNLHGHPPIPFHAYKLFFLCDILGGVAKAEKEIADVGFFSKDAIPPLSLTRVTPEQVALLFEYRLHPEWQTHFD